MLNKSPRQELLHFALPIRPRDGSITARQVRSTGLGLLLLSAWFLLAAFLANQSMKPTAPFRNNFSVFATTPCRGLSLSR